MWCYCCTPSSRQPCAAAAAATGPAPAAVAPAPRNQLLQPACPCMNTKCKPALERSRLPAAVRLPHQAMNKHALEHISATAAVPVNKSAARPCLRVAAVLDVLLPVQEPVGDLVGAGVGHDGHDALQLLGRQLAGAARAGQEAGGAGNGQLCSTGTRTPRRRAAGRAAGPEATMCGACCGQHGWAGRR